MTNVIIIKKKVRPPDSTSWRVVSVRVRKGLLEQLDSLARQADRSRTEIINILLESAIDIVKIDEA